MKVGDEKNLKTAAAQGILDYRSVKLNGGQFGEECVFGVADDQCDTPGSGRSYLLGPYRQRDEPQPE